MQATCVLVEHSAIMGMQHCGLIFLFNSISLVTSLQLGMSLSPGVNLWVGERLFLECRVAGGEHREKETVVWYRQQGLVMGEIISHGDTMVTEDLRFKLEKTVFEDLAIYKIEIMDVEVEDAGEYSCEMTEEEEEEDKIREFVTVAVFERQSEEEMSE